MSFILRHDGTCDGDLNVNGTLKLEETGAGTDKITIQAPNSIASAYTLTLPDTDGDPDQYLKTDGSGGLSWATVSGGSGGSSSGFNLSLKDTQEIYASDGTDNNSIFGNTLAWSSSLNLFVSVAHSGTDRVFSSSNGITWTARTSPVTNQFYAVTWAPEISLFAVVAASGTNNRVITSPDGITWTSRTTPVDNAWFGLAWSPDLTLFAAVAQSGSSNRVMTSPDGITWTTRSTPVAADNAWTDITWSSELGLFVAVATGVTDGVMTSPDGITWTTRTTVNNGWRAVAWSSELSLFAAVANTGTNRVMTSSDGITWTTRTPSDDTNSWEKVIWSSELGLFVAVSDTGTDRMMTSPDGINWTAKNIGSNATTSLAWSPELNVLVSGINLTKTFMYIGSLLSTTATIRSDDIILRNETGSVTISTPSLGADYTLTLPVDTGTFGQVLTTSGSGVLSWSDASGGGSSTSSSNQFLYELGDQENFTMAISNKSYSTGNFIVYSSELSRFVAVSTTTANGIMYSSDGKTWSETSAAENNQWRAVTWAPSLNLFAAVSNTGTNRVITSPDGITWTTRTQTESNSWTSITWSEELTRFVAVAGSGTNRVMYSSDGITWSPAAAAEANSWQYVMWARELSLFVSCSSSGTNRIMTSSDGITWETQTLNESASWSSIAWSSSLNLLVAVAASGTNRVATSPDGITWTTRTPAESNSWYGVQWIENLNYFLAVSTNGTNRIMTSANGIDWVSETNIDIETTVYGYAFSSEQNALVIPYSGTTNALRIEYDLVNKSGIKTGNIKLSEPSGSNIIKIISPSLTSDINLVLPDNDGSKYGMSLSVDGSGNTYWKETIGLDTSVDLDNKTKITSDATGNMSYSSKKHIKWAPELGRFVAISTSGTERAVYSDDGKTWTAVTVPENNTWTCLEWSPELSLFVTLSTNGTNRAMTSPDGITWTTRTIGTFSWQAVTWSKSLGIFVAIHGSANPQVTYSSDGITWLTANSASVLSWEDVTWSEKLGIFVAVADTGTGTNRVMTSENGINWTLRSGTEENTWKSVTWSSPLDRFVALASSGTNRVMYSSDGITWETASATETNNWVNVDWIDDLNTFIAFASNGTNRAMSSTDGITWTAHDIGTDLNYTAAWSPTLRILASPDHSSTIIDIFNIKYDTLGIVNSTKISIENISGNSTLLKSSDNLASDYTITFPDSSSGYKKTLTTTLNNVLEWSEINPKTNESFNLNLENNINEYSIPDLEGILEYESGCITSSDNLIVMVSNDSTPSSSDRVSYSSDGKTWNSTPTASNLGYEAVTWSSDLDLFVAVGNNRIMSSPDGTTWTVRTSPQANIWSSVIWISELSKFVAVSEGGTNRVMTSSDGITWETQQQSSSSSFQGIAWSPELQIMVACTTSSITMYSSDGINWTNGTTSNTANYKGLVWSSKLGIFVAVATTGTNRVVYSSDGISWTTASAAEANSWNDLTWSEEIGEFFAVAINGTNRMMRSSDGINWTAQDIGSDPYYAVHWSSKLGKLIISKDDSNNVLVYDNTFKNLYNVGGSGLVLSDNTYDIIMKPSDTLSSDYTIKLPSSQGIKGQVMENDGNGNLSWVDNSEFSTVNDLTNFKSAFVDTESNFNYGRNCITWSPYLNMFAAVTTVANGTEGIITSTDGVNWVTRTEPEDNQWRSVKWIPEINKFYAISSSGSNRLMESSDGITWTSLPLTEATVWYDFTYSDSLKMIVAVGSGTNRIITSTDFGNTWITRTSPQSNTWQAVEWSPELNLFVSVSSTGTNRAMTSPNGTSWTTRTINTLTYEQLLWVSDLSLFVATSSLGGHIVTSPNGIDWTLQQSLSDTIRGITWASDLSLLLIVTDNSNLYQSSDALTWTTRTILDNKSYYGIEWGGNDIQKIVAPVTSSKEFVYTTEYKRNTTNPEYQIRSISIADESNNKVNISYSSYNENYNIKLPGSVTNAQGKNLSYSGSESSMYWGEDLYSKSINNGSVVTVTTKTDNSSISINRPMLWVPELELFVISFISGTERIMYSSDAVTWNNVVVEANQWNSIAWSPELTLLVAVSSNGTNRVMTSPDAVTWTTRTAAEANGWRDVAWSPSLGIFVALSNSGTNRCMTSPDGITWTTRTIDALTWSSVAWSKTLGMFVAVNSSGTNKIYFSYDGINWQGVKETENSTFQHITWSDDVQMFMALSSGPTSNRVSLSSDGINWTAYDVGINQTFVSAVWISELDKWYIQSTSSTTIYSSPDGKTWTIEDIPSDFSGSTYNLAWSPKLKKLITFRTGSTDVYVFDPFAKFDKKIQVEEQISFNKDSNFLSLKAPTLTSDISLTLPNDTGSFGQVILSDGQGNMSWGNANQFNENISNKETMVDVPGTSNFSHGFGHNIIWVEELSLFVAVMNGGTTFERVMYSSDAKTWTVVTVPENNQFRSVAWSPTLNLLVAVSTNGTNQIMTSPDAITWTTRTEAESGAQYYDTIWASGLNLFVSVAITGTDRVQYSSDGITWTNTNSANDSAQWRALSWSPELEILVGVGTSVAMSSTNGTSWSSRSIDGSTWVSVDWSPSLGIFVAVASSGTNRVSYSSNGTSWDGVDVGTTTSFSSVLWVKEINKFVAMASGGTYNLATSSDGINWEFFTTDNDYIYYALAWSPSLKLFCSPRNISLQVGVFNILLSGNSTISTSRYIIDDFQTGYNFEFKIPSTASSDYTLTVPDSIGSYNQTLKTYSDGNIIWEDDQINFLPDFTLNRKDSNFYKFNTTDNLDFWRNSIASSDDIIVAISYSTSAEGIITSTDGITWTTRTNPVSGGQWRGVTWSRELDLFVAVGGAGVGERVMTSPDGITWTTRSSAADNQWVDVIWISELTLFVAVSSDGTDRIMTSPDGITWTLRDNGSNVTFASIVWSPRTQRMVAVGSSSTLIYSSDGINWDNDSIGASNQWNSISWSEELGLFVVVAGNSSNRIRYATDPLGTWTAVTGFDSVTWNKLIWAKEFGKFFAVGGSGGTNRLISSSDGINWTDEDIGSENYQCIHWASSQGNLIISNDDDENILVYNVTMDSFYTIKTKDLVLSNNTGNITLKTPTLSSNYSLTLPTDTGTDTQVLTTDGTGVLTWSNNSEFSSILDTDKFNVSIVNKTDNSSITGNAITWSDELGLFVTLFSSGTERSMTSPDGINWTTRIVPEGGWQAISWSSELSLFAAVASNGTNKIMTSSDGINWTTRTEPQANTWTCLEWSPELSLFVSLCTSGTNRVMTSSDGITWVTQNFTEASGWADVVWNGTQFLASASSGTNQIATSSDGITWVTQTDPAQANQWVSVAWSPELSLYAVCSWLGTNRIYTSPDGSTWTPRSPPSDPDYRTIIWSSETGKFYVGASDSSPRVISSTDGITWSAEEIFPNNRQYYQLAWSGKINTLVAINNTYNDVVSLTPYKSNIDSYNVKELYLTNTSEDKQFRLSAPYLENTYNLKFPYNNNDSGGKVLTSGGKEGRSFWSDKNTLISETFNNFTINTSDSPDSNNFSSNYMIEWSETLGIYAALSNSGTNRGLYSTDGVTWTSVAIETNTWTALIINDAAPLFVGVSNNGTNRVITSPDGINWTTRVAAESTAWRSLTYSPELDLYVAIGNGGTNRLMTSSDTITWTTQDIGTDVSWQAITWSSSLGKFVAIGSSGTRRVLFSEDGTNWKRTYLGEETISVTNLAWSEELGLFVCMTSDDLVVSSDGINWTEYIAQISTAGSWRAVKWVKEYNLFFACSSTVAIYLAYSPDGINWTNANISFPTSSFTFAYSPTLDKFAFARSSGNDFFLITPGISSSGLFSSQTLKLGDSNGEITLAVPSSLDKNYTFTFPNNTEKINSMLYNKGSGILDWKYINLSKPKLSTYDSREIIDGVDTNLNINSISYSPELELFVGVSSSGTSGERVITSTDGINWTTRTTPEDNNWTWVTWSPDVNLFVAVSNNGTNRVMTSPDGINWTTRTQSTDSFFARVIWAGGDTQRFVAIGTSGTGRVMYSSDGINWTNGSISSFSYVDITYSPELDMLVTISTATSGNTIYRSVNGGQSWSVVAPPEYNGWESVTWSGKLGIFAAVGDSGSINRIITSTDGITWVTKNAPESASYQHVRWIPEMELFFAIATNFSRSMYSFDGDTWIAYDISNFTSTTYQYFEWNSGDAYFISINNSDNILHIYTDLGAKGNVISNGVYTNNLAVLDENSTALTIGVPELQSSYSFNLPPSLRSSGHILELENDSGQTTWAAPLLNKNVPTKFEASYSSPNGSDTWFCGIWVEELELYIIGNSVLTEECIATSPDGITWTTRVAANVLAVESIAWSPRLQLLAAVGDDGTNRVITSPDGITWTTRTSANETTLWSSIVWASGFNNGNGRFCAAAAQTSNNFMYSDDGITWTIATSTASDLDVRDLVYSESQDEVIGVSVAGADRIVRTTTGTSWSDNSTTNDTLAWTSIAYSPTENIYVAINTNTNSATKINYSTIGSSGWTNVLGFDSSLQFDNVQWVDYLKSFIVTARNAIDGNSFYISPDGINWSPVETGLNVINLTKPIINNTQNKFLLFTSTQGYYMYSVQSQNNEINTTNLITAGNFATETYHKQKYKLSNALLVNYKRMINDWYTASVPEENTWNDAVWVETTNQFISCAASGTNRIMKSTDGFTWSTVIQNTIAGSTGNQNVIAVDDNVIIVGTRSSLDSISYSDDGGDTWNDANHPNITSRLWNDIVFSPERKLYVVVGYNGANTNRVMTTSSTGLASGWVTRGTPDITNNWVGVTWSPELDMFVACSNSGSSDRIMTSTNGGITWNTRTTPNGNSYTDIAWSSELGLFASCSNSGTLDRIMTSPDGINWTSRTTPVDNAWFKIKWIGEIGMFVVVASTDATDSIMTSSDGINWHTKTVPNSTASWRSVSWSPELACLVGVGTGSTMKAMHTIL